MDGQMKIVIDADFFRNITEYEHGVSLFLRVVDGLNMEPIMHVFVAESELEGSRYLKQLLDTGKIQVIHYDDYLMSEDRVEYEKYFRAAYERINQLDFLEGCDIYEYEEKGESLGEIRSFYMAKIMGCQYFISDDADARTLANNFYLGKNKVDVRSLYEVFVMCKERNIGLRWKDINPTVCNAMNKRQDKVAELRALYYE